MTIVRINAIGDRPRELDPGALTRALAALPEDAPVVVMIHGFKYAPSVATRSPHVHILSHRPMRGGRSTSWPKHLGFGRPTDAPGLCIALGWEARGTIWGAAGRANDAGAALAELIDRIGLQRAAPVDIFAHSLGARVGLTALPTLRAGQIGRMILLSAAEFRGRAARLADTPAGRAAEIVNVTCPANRVFDLMFEQLLQPVKQFDRALGSGLAEARANWLDLPIDCDATRAGLARLGYPTRPPSQRVCHWAGYLRPGLFRLYAALLRGEISPAVLRSALPASIPIEQHRVRLSFGPLRRAENAPS